MNGPLVVGVLANDNPQGLLLACRLLSYARVRVSVGGRLGRLLEDGWALKTENLKGQTVNVKTHVLRRGEENSTKELEEKHGLDVLWICDWKDPATGWYSLSDCHLILQTSKATDSKTVAMWLVEVCKDDAVIISLQAGLHNARELRAVFGHSGSPLLAERDMPLVATNVGRRPAGSIDTVDGALTRRDSASSIYSEFSAMDEDCDVTERSASPIPPGFTGLPSPSSSDSHEGNRERRKSLLAFDETANTVAATDASSKNNGNAENTETSHSENAAPLLVHSLKKPDVVLLAGLSGYGASLLIDDSSKTVKCVMTHHGYLVVERLTAENARQAFHRVTLLEWTGFGVRYRPSEETNNWLWGDVVWRTFEAYGAAIRLDKPNEHRSLYALLCDSNTIHRRVYAGLLDEALSALRWQKVELMDPVSSPFGLSFRLARSLLLLPGPVFPLCLWIVLCLRFPLEQRIWKEAPYCDSTLVHRYMAPFLNGEVVRIGFEGEVLTPLNQEILESLSVVTRQQTSRGAPIVSATPLPPIYSMSFFIAITSCIVALAAVLIRFIVFAVEVIFTW